MEMDYGLLGGLAEALKSGYQSYQTEQDRKVKRGLLEQERADKLKQQQLDALSKGYRLDEKGEYVYDPESAYAKKLGLEESKQDAYIKALMTKDQRAQYDMEMAQKKLDLDKQKLSAEVASKGLIQTDAGYELSPEQRELKKQQAGLLAARNQSLKAKSSGVGNPVKATSAQFQAARFARRMEQAEKVFDSLEKEGYKAGSRLEKTKGLLPQEFQTQNLKKQLQAQRNFINSVLRDESGATISPEEFKNAELQYTPQPGDTPEVLKQKKLNRLQLIEAMKAESGPALDATPLITDLKEKNEINKDDKDAIDWLSKNPKHPKAESVRSALKAKGLL